jgi:hypothetical protein
MTGHLKGLDTRSRTFTALCILAGLSAQAANAAGQMIACRADSDQRVHCDADVSGGVSLQRSTGNGQCLLGRSWGYDSTGIWVAERCGGEFMLGESTAQSSTAAASQEPVRPTELSEPATYPAVLAAAPNPGPEYIGNLGFKIYESERAQIYMRLFSYVRYLNQKGLDATYTDSFGNEKTVDRREDVQLNKFSCRSLGGS